MVITATERAAAMSSTPERSANSVATFRCLDRTVPLVSALSIGSSLALIETDLNT